MVTVRLSSTTLFLSSLSGRLLSQPPESMVNGKQCGVAPSQNSDTLFVGNICKTWTKDVLKNSLQNMELINLKT